MTLKQIDWTPTRAAGLARLDAFIPHAGEEYARNRNFDFGPEDRSNVSALSPWLSAGALDERQVLAATLAEHGPEGADKFVQEVFWRGYFRGWLEHRPAVWREWRREVAGMGNPRGYAAAVEGRTGIDCFDAWATELVETGWLHNHARMWFASIWIFTLRLPWQLGADFFLRHLMDGDAASNTLSWRWVAGLHTQGKSYLAERQNIRRYTADRFDPQGLAGAAFEVSGAENPDPGAVPDAPEVREDDLHLATQENVRPGRACISVDLQLDGCASEGAAREFRSGLLLEAGTPLPDIGAVIEHARAEGHPRIAIHAFPTGPVADAITARRAEFEAAGLEVLFPRRPYDAAVWPHAKKGFFKLKKKIPQLLSELALD